MKYLLIVCALIQTTLLFCTPTSFTFTIDNQSNDCITIMQNKNVVAVIKRETSQLITATYETQDTDKPYTVNITRTTELRKKILGKLTIQPNQTYTIKNLQPEPVQQAPALSIERRGLTKLPPQYAKR